MPPRPTTDSLLLLLRAQRGEVAIRSSFERSTPAWMASSTRLDELNDQIMHFTDGRARHDAVGMGLELALDSRPAQDVRFRRLVLNSIRKAVVLTNSERLAAASGSRLEAASHRIARTKRLIRHAELTVRDEYPEASLERDTNESETDTIAVRADREGRVA